MLNIGYRVLFKQQPAVVIYVGIRLIDIKLLPDGPIISAVSGRELKDPNDETREIRLPPDWPDLVR